MKDFNSIKINGSIVDKTTILSTDLEALSSNFEKEIFAFLQQWFSKENYVDVHTSGSTGIPKLLSIPKEKMLVSASLTGQFFNFKKNQKALLCMSAKHIGGIMMLVRALAFEMDLFCVKPSNNPLATINQDIDFAAMVPYQVQSVLDQNLNKINLIRNLIIGGGSISYSLEEQLKKVETHCFSTFGMTETISHIALRKIGSESYYKCMQGIHVSYYDKNKLCIHAPMLHNSDIKTNDLVELKNENEFKWLGRADFAIESGGLKYIPELIEKKLEPFIQNRFFIASLPDERLNNRIILVVEQKEKLPKNIFDSLTKFEKPKEVYYLSRFIETKNGKINRLETLELLA